jgi:hypothetical protein
MRRESVLSEDLTYLQLKEEMMSKMNKMAKHMVVYSNINHSNFVDLNELPAVKAWAILFHFRSKSIESQLYEQFAAIAQRNSIAKSRSHEHFNELFMKMLEQCSKVGLMLNMSQICKKTGWPVDILVKENKAFTLANKDRLPKGGSSSSEFKAQYAIYLLLREELCYNTKNITKMEPLGLQKLMKTHLSSLGDHRMIFVNEDEVYRDLDGALENIMTAIRTHASFGAQNSLHI